MTEKDLLEELFNLHPFDHVNRILEIADLLAVDGVSVETTEILYDVVGATYSYWELDIEMGKIEPKQGALQTLKDIQKRFEKVKKLAQQK